MREQITKTMTSVSAKVNTSKYTIIKYNLIAKHKNQNKALGHVAWATGRLCKRLSIL